MTCKSADISQRSIRLSSIQSRSSGANRLGVVLEPFEEDDNVCILAGTTVSLSGITDRAWIMEQYYFAL